MLFSSINDPFMVYREKCGMSVGKRYSMAVAFLVSSVAVAQFAMPPGRSQVLADEQSEQDDGTPPETNWELLNFRTDDSRKIVSIEWTITQEQSKLLTRMQGIMGHLDPGTIEITDPELLRMAEFCFDCDNCIRPIVPEGWNGGWSGAGFPYGTVKIKTNLEEFVIGVTCMGFAMESDSLHLRNRFFAPAAAELIGSWYEVKHKGTFPVQLVEILSGSHHIREVRANLRRFRKDGE